MGDRTILTTGLVGTVIAVICCFSPILVLLLGAAGLSAWVGWLDYVLFPALAMFVAFLAYGLWLRSRSRGRPDDRPTQEQGGGRYV